MVLQFAEFEIDTARYQLRRNGEPVEVEPLVFDLLAYFASHPDQVLSHQQLIDAIWAGRVVSDATVSTCIKNARRALGDSGSAQTYIKTVRGRGFTFNLPATGGSANDPQSSLKPDQTLAAASVIELPLPGQTPDDGKQSFAGKPSVAVLPLLNLSHDPDKFLFGDAIAQEIIVDLSKLHWLAVVARGSSFKFRDAAVDLQEAGRFLGARYFLTGSVEVIAGKGIVTVEFSQAQDQRILWADRFECELAELMRLRQTISSRIVAEIEARVHDAEVERAIKLPTEDLDAWSAYHRGLWHMYRFNRQDNVHAQQMFSRSVKADPQFARAYAGLSFTHFQNAFLHFEDDASIERKLAREFAERAYELDPRDPFANLTMGRSAWLENDLDSAGAWLDRGLELSPNYAFAMYNRALISVLGGHGVDSEAAISKAMALSPIDPLNYAMMCTRGLSHLIRDEPEKAVIWVNKAVREPTAHAHISLIAALTNEIAGSRDEALRLMSKLRKQGPGYTFGDFISAFPFQDAAFRSRMSTAFDTLQALSSPSPDNKQ